MRVELAPAVFTATDGTQDVLALLRCFSQGRHDWTLSPSALDAVRDFLTRNLLTLAATYMALAEKSATRSSAYTPSGAPAPVRVTMDDLADCCADLRRDAVVVVENNNADGLFIRAIARAEPDLECGITTTRRAPTTPTLEAAHTDAAWALRHEEGVPRRCADSST